MEIHTTITKVLRKYYGIEKPTVLKMEGYESSNYKISVQGTDYVLKIYKASAKNLEWVHAENALLHLLESKEFPCSRVVPSSSGAYQIVYKDSLYRLLNFVHGSFLAEVPHTEPLLRSFGTFLAKMDILLSSFQNNVIRTTETAWDIKHLYKNWVYIDDITNSQDRSLVHYFGIQFKKNITPHHYTFRQSILHNDANDWNILVHNEQVTGIIDFGDMCYTWLINELAIALTYVLMNKENPLEVAKTVLGAYHTVNPLRVLELDALYYLIGARLCTSVLNSAHSKKRKPSSEYIVISEKPAWKLLRKWVAINPIQAKNYFRAACGYSVVTYETLEKQVAHRHRNSSQALSLSYEKPIQMQSAAFQYMFDIHGNTFLDAYNNIMQVGHCHPTVVKAGQDAMERLNTNTRYIYKEYLSYTDKLLAKFPKELSQVFLVNSGSAASDLAIRMAKTHTHRTMIMVLEHGYHGNTENGIAISHYKYSHKGGKGKPKHIIQAKLPKVFGSGYTTEEEACQQFVKKVKKQIERYKGKIAAFIAEPIVGCGGQVPLPQNYLKEVYQLIREQGGICISDEVQVGFGRLGACFWGYQLYNVVPDIVILGKPIGNGHPMGAVVSTHTLSTSFHNGMEFFSSFGGNPVSCAIGEAVLDVLEKENLQQKAYNIGNFLKKGLHQLQQEHPEIADVRGKGLFLGVELMHLNKNPNGYLAKHICNELRNKHILLSTDGPYNNVLKIKPPLYFNKENASQLLLELNRILEKK